MNLPNARGRTMGFAALAAAGLFVAGCAQNAPQDTTDPAGESAQMIYDLSWPIFAIAGIVGVLVISVITFVVIRDRDRGQPIPEQTHGKPILEIGLTILPALILIGVAIPTVGTLMALNDYDDTECVVNVTGQQWWWEFDYPVQDGCGGITEPIVTSGQMVIPADTDVLIRGTSRDVIHSFWIPRLNGKRDMVPGRVHSLKMQADEPGIYAGQCAEFCGLSHANMRMEVVALNDGDFETWKANQLEDYESPIGEQALAGEAAFVANCSRCHQVDGITDADGVPIVSRPDLQVYPGAAPNLTNLMTRNTFAGASWDLIDQDRRDEVWNADPDEFGALYLAGVEDSWFNEIDLREWLRNAPLKKPMYADPLQLDETDGLYRGMPNLALSEDQIDDLLAYLLELK
ncbi:MAG: cytochrome c oxidase subunit II [Ilumatobacter sp.]|uniref:cytochrome c oxidase subunit II n=1 Tax=Ilumatobacter sp. TaxID=1967498 RepID=UPI00329A293C